MTKANKVQEAKKAFANDPNFKRIQKHAGKPKSTPGAKPGTKSGGKKR